MLKLLSACVLIYRSSGNVMNYRLVDGGKRETSGIYMRENVIITYHKKYIN